MFCQVVKTTNKTNGGTEKVAMELILRNAQGTMSFPFFDTALDDPRDLSYRFKKSQYWKRQLQISVEHPPGEPF
jgi:hypothetical protein